MKEALFSVKARIDQSAFRPSAILRINFTSIYTLQVSFPYTRPLRESRTQIRHDNGTEGNPRGGVPYLRPSEVLVLNSYLLNYHRPVEFLSYAEIVPPPSSVITYSVSVCRFLGVDKTTIPI